MLTLRISQSQDKKTEPKSGSSLKRINRGTSHKWAGRRGEPTVAAEAEISNSWS